MGRRGEGIPLNTSVDGGLRQTSVPGEALILKEDILLLAQLNLVSKG